MDNYSTKLKQTNIGNLLINIINTNGIIELIIMVMLLLKPNGVTNPCHKASVN